MKFLEAQRKAKEQGLDNKMQSGSRTDQDGTQKTSQQLSDERAEHEAEVVELAHSLNVDLNTLTGSGKGGKITKGDVRKADGVRAMGNVSR